MNAAPTPQTTGEEPDAALCRRVRRAEQLFEINAQLIAVRDPEALLRFIIEAAADVLGCEAGSVLLFDEGARTLRFAAASGPDADALARIPVPLGSSLAGTIFTENRPLIVGDVAQDARHFDTVGDTVAFDARSLLGVPMCLAGTPIGVLEALNKAGGPFTRADVETLSVIATQAAVAIRNARQMRDMEHANAQLSRLDALKSDFLALASHELRTPLSSILGYGAILKEEAAPPLSEFAALVLDAANQMLSVVETMGHMETLRSASTRLDAHPAILQHLLQEARAEAAPLAEAGSHTLTLLLPERPLTVQADPVRLRLAFVNLLENALQFSPEGAPVTVRAAAQNGVAHVQICDNGIGIAPAEIEHIFDEFYQVEDHLSRTHGGLGLGLTIARELIGLHGGCIRAESPGLGEGTTLHVQLPVAASTLGAPPPAAASA